MAAPIHFSGALARRAAQGSVRELRAGAAHARRRARGDLGGAPPTRYDPLARAVIADPYPAYRELLAGPAVHCCPRHGIWVITHYDAVRAAARAHDELSNADSVTRLRFRVPMLLTVDRPEHTRLRKLVARDFTREAMQRWRPDIERMADDGLDALAGGGDFYSALAAPLPTLVIAHTMGIPEADYPRFRRWSDHAVEGFGVDVSLRSPGAVARTMGATVRLHHYFLAQRERRRLDPGDDVLSRLAPQADGAEPLTADEFFWFCLLLLVAGNETTVNLLGNMAYLFATHPEQYDRVRADPALIPSAVEECLRYIAPIQGFYRTALSPYAVGDATIPAGARVLLSWGAANRDPRKYPDPDVFDVARNPADHVAFGLGIHFCLGAHLARLEGQVVLERLVRRVARIELAGEPRWSANPNLRGPVALPVRLRLG